MAGCSKTNQGFHQTDVRSNCIRVFQEEIEGYSQNQGFCGCTNIWVSTKKKYNNKARRVGSLPEFSSFFLHPKLFSHEFMHFYRDPQIIFLLPIPAKTSWTDERNSPQPKQIINEGFERCEIKWVLSKSFANFQCDVSPGAKGPFL